jgi:hypothetical protein
MQIENFTKISLKYYIFCNRQTATDNYKFSLHSQLNLNLITHSLHTAESFFWFLSWWEIFLHFMQPKDSLPCLKRSTTCPYKLDLKVWFHTYKKNQNFIIYLVTFIVVMGQDYQQRFIVFFPGNMVIRWYKTWIKEIETF